MITAAAARAFLNSPATDDPLLTAIISRATSTLERDLGYYLGTPAAREYYASGGSALIVVPDDVIAPTDEAPIVVATLETDQAFTTVATTDYRRIERRFIHRTTWPEGYANVRITYRAGYELDAGPGELRDLLLRLVALRYRDAGSDGVQSETLSDYSYTLKQDTTLWAEWSDIARRYSRRLPV